MKKLIYKILKKLGFKREAPRCYDCKHTNKSFDDEPCCYCDKNSEWEAQSDARN